jgi:hypothetical protein
MKALILMLVAFFLLSPVQAKYSGGSGTPGDPYQIATAADLIALGEMPGDYDKHFILTADIDLSPNLPGRKVFDKAVIAPNLNAPTPGFQARPFTGVFDGNGHTISHLTLAGGGYLGLFGHLGQLYAPPGDVRDLGLLGVNVTGSGDYIGGLAGDNLGNVARCYSAGVIRGGAWVGGLVGSNGGTITDSYAAGSVAGDSGVGGLAGATSGWYSFPGLGLISNCYSVSAVTGRANAGGLLGTSQRAEVIGCFWDIETSGQATSARGTGKTTAEMQAARTFLLWATCGNEGTWTIDEGRDYPRLRWENRPGEPIVLASSLRDLLTGEGTVQSPYLIRTAAELNWVGLFPCDKDKHYKLMADIDLSAFGGKDGRPAFNIIGDCCLEWDEEEGLYVLGTPFSGVFDGNRHTISRLTVQRQEGCAGLFGGLSYAGEIKNLGVVDVNITSSSYDPVGALVGFTYGRVIGCYSTGVVRGIRAEVGGLVGLNVSQGSVTHCYSRGVVSGTYYVGGLVGATGGTVTDCYSTAAVRGTSYVGGLVGDGSATACFWDTETSGQATSAGGTGKTTAAMQDPNTFMAVGWDFVGQPDGPHDIWAEPVGGGYPILWWQQSPLPRLPTFSGGTGESDDPYRISTPGELNSIGYNPRLLRSHFELVEDLDLGGMDFYIIGSEFCPFAGSFNGNGHTISHLTIKGGSYVGLFARLEAGAEVGALGVLDVNIAGSGDYVGGLVGRSGGLLLNCYTTGAVRGENAVGGLVGYDYQGTVTQCHSASAVNGDWTVGGLVGFNSGLLTQCYSTGTVSAMTRVGGLVGATGGTVTDCYSTAAVRGTSYVGGLVGESQGQGSVTQCYSSGAVSGENAVGGLVGYRWASNVTASFWDIQTSGQITSAEGTGKTTAEMQTAKTFLKAGWDFVGETANGTEDIWWILEGQDYPRLWWEARIDDF